MQFNILQTPTDRQTRQTYHVRSVSQNQQELHHLVEEASIVGLTAVSYARLSIETGLEKV